MYYNIFENKVFSLFTQQERTQLLHGAKTINFESGQEIFFQGEDITYYYFVISGSVKVYRLDIHGDERVMNVIPQGNFVAHIANMLHPRVYPVTVSAVKNAEVLRLNTDIFIKVLQNNHNATQAFMAEMVERIYKQVSYIDTLKNNSAVERVKAFLLTTEGTVTNNQKHIELYATKRIVAQQLSLTPECFSRCLNTLKKQNILTVDKNTLIIRNFTTFAEYYE